MVARSIENRTTSLLPFDMYIFDIKKAQLRTKISVLCLILLKIQFGTEVVSSPEMLIELKIKINFVTKIC